MGNYALYQTEVKTEKSQKAMAWVSFMENELNVRTILSVMDEPTTSVELNEETYAMINAMDLSNTLIVRSDEAPNNTPEAALHPLIHIKADSIILYIPFTAKAGIIDESSPSGYTSDMFDPVINFANKLKDILEAENINHVIAYDAKSEYETYVKRPFKKLTM